MSGVNVIQLKFLSVKMNLLSAKVIFYFVHAIMRVEFVGICIDFFAKKFDYMGIRRRENMPLYAPNSQGNVRPKQVCPAFEPRDNTLNGLRQ